MAYDNTRGERPERKMFQGNWSCGKCGADIKELPFDPNPARLSELKCRDCFRKSRGEQQF